MTRIPSSGPRRRASALLLPLLALAACGDDPAPPAPGPVTGEPIAGAPIDGTPLNGTTAPEAIGDVAPVVDVPQPAPTVESRVPEPAAPTASEPTAPPPTPEPPAPVPAPPAEPVASEPSAPPTPVVPQPPTPAEPPVAKPEERPGEPAPEATPLPDKPEPPAKSDAAAKDGVPDASKSAERKSLLPKDRKKGEPLVLSWEQLASFDYIPPPPAYADPVTGQVPDQTAELEKAKKQIPAEIWELEGETVTVEGYMIPLEYAEDEGVKSFLLSRHAMGCCFGVMPRAHELVECDMGPGKSAPYVGYLTVKITGKLHVGPKEGPQTFLSGIYFMDAPTLTFPDPESD